MASTLTLDRSDKAVDEMVSAWKNGGQYEVRLRIQQIGSDPKAATFHVAEVTNESEESRPMEADGEAAVDAEEAPPPAKPAVAVKY
jgi:hypothetical protein